MGNNLNLTADSGQAFARVVEWVDEDDVVIPLTDYTAELVITDKKTCETTTLTVATGNLTITPLLGKIDIAISVATLETLGSFNDYFLRVTTPGGTPTKLLEGFFSVDKNAC